MSCSKHRTEVFVLAILYLLPLKTLAGKSCKLVDKMELNYTSDYKSSFPNCTELDEEYRMFFSSKQLQNAQCMLVCYNGINETSGGASSLQAYFIVYHKTKSERNDSQSLTEMCQQTRAQNSKMCKTIVLDNWNEGKVYFGMFVPKECFKNNYGGIICPLNLHVFNKSNGIIPKRMPKYGIQMKNLYRRDLLNHLRSNSPKSDDVNLEDKCMDLDIRIEYPDPTRCGTESSLKCSTSSMCSVNCLRLEDCDKNHSELVIVCVITLVIISVLSVVVAVMCYREKCKGKQAHSTEHDTTIPHINDTSTKLNTYHGAGPSTSTYDPKSVVAISLGNAHDYDDIYFEPASKEEALVAQIRKLGVAEISRESKRLRLFEVIGGGAFGTVQRGVWLHSGSSSEQLVEEEVAVKSMDGVASEEERIKFLQEAAIMGQFNHPNIIMILGIMSDTPMMILIEIMKAGDLRNHILDINKSNKSSVPDELTPTLLSYSRQVASGMVYLALKKFVHRDLAARNILVSDNGTCKIADFGLSRDLQDATYYKSHGGKIPVKWTAPEALHYQKYSNSSDVWSYGCVLYEIWSLGYKPFHEDTNAEIIKKVATGFRLPPPPGCPGAIYDIMIQCWHPEAAQRPSFFDLTVSLQKPDFMLLQWSGEELKICTEEARTLGSPLDAGRQLHVDLQRTYMVGAEKVTNWRQESVNSEPSQNEDEYKEINV